VKTLEIEIYYYTQIYQKYKHIKNLRKIDIEFL